MIPRYFSQTEQGRTEYDLCCTQADGGDAIGDTATTARSTLLYDRWKRPFVHNVTDGDNVRPLFQKDWNSLALRERRDKDSTPEQRPEWFGVKGSANGDGWNVKLYRTPDGVYDIETRWNIPQELLETDGSDEGTNIRYPERCLYLGTLYLAMNERGEEIGEPGHIVRQRYYDSLSESSPHGRRRTD